MGTCTASGDPHVLTFDGANNDVYGVAEYILVESSSNATSKFRIRMSTSPWSRNTSVVKAIFFDFFDALGQLTATVKTDDKGNSDFLTNGVSRPLTSGHSGPNATFAFSRINNKMTTFDLQTGVEVSQQGTSVSVKVPILFMGKVQGLCGNFNFDPEDDYQCKNGTVFSYTPLSGYIQSKRSVSLKKILLKSPFG